MLIYEQRSFVILIGHSECIADIRAPKTQRYFENVTMSFYWRFFCST